MTTVRVYSKPQCQACVMTKRVLDQHGVAYIEEDIQEPHNLEAVMFLGHMQAPVVMAGDEHWSGFQPDRIKELATRIGGNA